MRDVIQRIVATEAEARQKVQAAKAEAERIMFEARKGAQELVAKARQSSRLEADAVLAAALRLAEAERSQRLAGATAAIEVQVTVEEATVRQAVAAVTRCVCGFHQTSRGRTP